MYDDDNVEKLIIDLTSCAEELEVAWSKNHEAVKGNIMLLKDARDKVSLIYSKVIASAA